MKTQYIPDLIGEAVTKVDEVLSKRVGNPFNVNYDFGHDLEVLKNLTNKDKALSKPKKYPLVWFVMNFKEKFGDLRLYSSLPGITLYILTDTRIDYSMKERRDLKYIPILYPILSELISQLSKMTKTFNISSEAAIQFDKIDMPYWSENGQKANFYNDFIDAIKIENLKLEVKKIC